MTLDLSMCDFYLWGFLKSRVYAGKPHILGELKSAIRENIQEIGEETLVKAEANFKKRLQICARENGHHLSDRGAGIGGEGGNCPLPFNILKTRGHRGADCAF